MIRLQDAVLIDDLQGLKTSSVMQYDKSKRLGVANGTDPSADGDLLTVQGGGKGVMILVKITQ